MQHKIAVGAAVFAASAMFAGPALADSTITLPSLTYNHVELATPALTAAVVTPSTQPLTLSNVTVDTTNGTFQVQPSGFSAPTYSFSSPTQGTISFALNGPANGQLDPSTGAVALNADIVATINLTAEGSCTIDTGSQTLSTAATEPLVGKDFPTGITGPATGAGAIGIGWNSLPTGTGPACALVDAAVGGPGGLWISRDISPTPVLTAKAPKTTKVAMGKSTAVKVTVTNAGERATTPVKVCLAATKPLTVSKCATYAPKAFSARTLTFKVNASKVKKAGSYKLVLTGTGLKKQTLAVKVSK